MYNFGVFVLDPERRLLTRSGEPVPLPPKSCDLLIHLVQSHGRLVTKAEIVAALWPGVTVEEGNVAFQVSVLRRALGQDASNWIETVPKHGYRFSAPVVTNAATSETVPPSSAPGQRRIASVGALVAICALALSILIRERPSAYAVSSPVPLTDYPGSEHGAAFSPDGQHVAFTWNGGTRNTWDIYIRREGSDEPLRWTETPDEEIGPAWSPDGRTIAFYRITGPDSADIVIKPWPDGPEVKVAASRLCAKAMHAFRPVTWHPKGGHLIVTIGATGEPCGLWALNLENGSSTLVTRPRELTRLDTHPAISSDGRRLAFTRAAHWLDSSVYVADLTDSVELRSAPQRVTGDIVAYNSVWLPNSNDLVFAGVENQPGAGLRLYRLRMDGSARPQLIGRTGDYSYSPAIAPGGSLAYTVRANGWTSLWRLDLRNDGRKGENLWEFSVSNRLHQMPRHSPDGRTIAFESNRSGSREIWTAEVSGSGWRQLTYLGGPPAQDPNWSPDGRYIAFTATIAGKQSMYIVPSAGGPTRKVEGTGSSDAWPTWTPDSSHLIFRSDQSGRHELWRVAVNGGTPLRMPGSTGRPHLAPNGRRLLFSQRQGNRLLIWKDSEAAASMEIDVGPDAVDLSFVVFDDAVYYARNAGGSFEIVHVDVRTRRPEIVATIPGKFALGMSVAPDRSHLMLTRVQEGHTNLMLFDKWR